jgi:hypothetical protein
LIVKGDPTTSARWLARQIDDLVGRVPRGDVRRQRVGARFDTNQGPVLVPLEHEEEQEQEQEQEEEEEDKEQAEQQQEADTGSTYAQETNYSNKHDRPASGTSNDNHSPQQTATQEQTQTAEARTDPPENAADTFQVFATDFPGKDSSNQQQTQAPQDSTAEPDNAKADDPSTPFFGTTESAAASSFPGLTCEALAVFGRSAKKEVDEESDDVSGETDVPNSWERFYEAAKDALLNCRSCLWWKTNPSNLVDTLHSIGGAVERMAYGPPEENSLCNQAELEQVIFCVTSFKREEQLKKALPLNLICLAPYRRFVKIALVTFGPDQELHRWLRHHLQWAVDEGLLKLASGGEASSTALPAELGCWRQRNGKLFESWHASVAKNTSHLVAMTGTNKDLSKTLLINLDNDNLVGNSYLAAVVQAALSCKQSWHGGACPAVTCGTGSLTGRLAYWALDFIALGGYDQERGIYPSGLKQVAETKKIINK